MRPRMHGAAIIIAMIVAALAATVTIAIAAEQQRWLAGVSARRDQVQAQSLALAAVQWTRQILLEQQGSVDYLGQPWAVPLPPTPLENGSIEGRIVDAQGLMNVNNLAQAGAAGERERGRFARLFARAGVGAAPLDALTRWVDSDNHTRAQGDEDAWYARQPTPYLAARAPLMRIGELAAVRGFDAAAVARVLPYVSALPAATPINVNTAPAPVLAALLQVRESDLAALVAERVTRPFTTVADFRSRAPQGVVIDDERALAVASSYFLVTVRARQGDTVAQARALLKRSPGAWPDVVWQTIE